MTLSSPTGGRLVDGTATGTIKNHDPLPRAVMARFGRAAAQHVVENVEERMAARRDPGVEVRIGGYDLFGQGPVRHDQQIPMHGYRRPYAGRWRPGGRVQRPGSRPSGDRGVPDESGDEAGRDAVGVEPERTIVLLGSRGSTVLNGEVRTRLFGADYAKGRIVTGLAIADSQGMGSYSRRLPVARSPPVCPGCIPGSATRRPSASRPGPRPGTGPAR